MNMPKTTAISASPSATNNTAPAAPASISPSAPAPVPTPPTDFDDLVRLACSGDDKAVGAIFVACGPTLLAELRSVMGPCAGDAADVLNDLAVSLLEGKTRFTPGAESGLDWLCAVARGMGRQYAGERLLEQPVANAGARGRPIRVRAFVDFWNFQLAMDRWRPRFRLDWNRLGPWLAQQAGTVVAASDDDAHPIYFSGMHVYLSYNPSAPKDESLRRWATGTLGRFPGVHITLKERRAKSAPTCPCCHKPVDVCPESGCRASMRGTTEKGIDTAIVTDMIRLAWDGAWDVAVLVSADGDFVPAIDLLSDKGRKVVHGALPPGGVQLARRCWGTFDVTRGVHELERRGRAAEGEAAACASVK